MILPNNVSVIILAAGMSSRMGRQKMLLPWGERTVLGQVIWTLNSAGLEDILVILGGNQVQVGGRL